MEITKVDLLAFKDELTNQAREIQQNERNEIEQNQMDAQKYLDELNASTKAKYEGASEKLAAKLEMIDTLIARTECASSELN